MIDFFEWFRTTPGTKRTWVIMGKGPTLDRANEIKNLDQQYATFGLNHACRLRNVFVAHMIDANVLDEIEDLDKKADYVAMPWQPHFAFKPTSKTLKDLVAEKPLLRDLDSKGKLLWYNLCTGNAPRHGSPIVQVCYFSAEAAVSMLGIAGVKKIRTLGVDGGKKYSSSFKDIKPFRGGHTTFDLQSDRIREMVKKHGLNYAPFFAP